MYKKGRISGTDYMCSGSFQARGAGWRRRQVRLPGEMGVGRIGTAEEERSMWRIPSKGPGAGSFGKHFCISGGKMIELPLIILKTLCKMGFGVWMGNYCHSMISSDGLA